MATLNRHKGIDTIFATACHSTRYAVCKDGKILVNRRGTGWKLCDSRITPEMLVANFVIDDSHAAKAIISRANADAHAHEGAKRTRRLYR